MANNDFDRIIRENAERILHRYVERELKMKISPEASLPTNFTGTFENKVDHLFRARDKHGQEVLLHFEYQTRDDPMMIYRMQRYHGIINYKYPLPIYHFVVYLGGRASKMKTQLPKEEVFREFYQISIQEEPLTNFLAASDPEELILGVLSNFGNRSPEGVIARIVETLRETVDNENDLGKYLKQLTILSELRRLDKVVNKVVERMPIEIDWSNFYPLRQAKEKALRQGLKEGREKGQQEERKRIFLDLAAQGIVSLEYAAKSIGITEREMKELIRNRKSGSENTL